VTGDHFAACLLVEPQMASQAQLQRA